MATAGEPRFNPFLGIKMHRVGTALDGLPIYSDLTEGLAQVLNRRIKSKRQNVVAYIGGTGRGKSTQALEVCIAQDPFFSLKNDYIYAAEDLARKLKKNPVEVSPVSLFDEGSVALNSLNSAKKGDRMTTVLFDTMRSRGWSTHICIPRLRSLNNRIREDHLTFIVDCGCRAPLPDFKARGFSLLWASKEPGTFSKGRYWDPVCYGVYPPLPKRIDEEYTSMKNQSQDRYLDDYIHALLGDDSHDDHNSGK